MSVNHEYISDDKRVGGVFYLSSVFIEWEKKIESLIDIKIFFIGIKSEESMSSAEKSIKFSTSQSEKKLKKI